MFQIPVFLIRRRGSTVVSKETQPDTYPPLQVVLDTTNNERERLDQRSIVWSCWQRIKITRFPSLIPLCLMPYGIGSRTRSPRWAGPTGNDVEFGVLAFRPCRTNWRRNFESKSHKQETCKIVFFESFSFCGAEKNRREVNHN